MDNKDSKEPSKRFIRGYGIVSTTTDVVGDEMTDAHKSVREHARVQRLSKIIRIVFIAEAVFSVAMIFGWGSLQRLWGISIDFGPLTMLCLFLLTSFIYFLAHSIDRFHKDIKTMQERTGILYYLLFPVIFGVLFLTAGYFEFRQQFAQIVATPPTQMISGKSNAIFKCDRLIESMIPKPESVVTRKGYVTSTDPDVTHANATACGAIFDWYFWQRRDNADNDQIYALDLVAHEAMHVGGEHSELIAKCGAVDWIEDVVQSLGASKEEARRIFEIDETNANAMRGNPLIQQTLQYEGHCDDVPNVRN